MNGYLERDNMYKLYIDKPSTIDKHWFNSYLPEGVGEGRFNKTALSQKITSPRTNDEPTFDIGLNNDKVLTNVFCRVNELSTYKH